MRRFEESELVIAQDFVPHFKMIPASLEAFRIFMATGEVIPVKTLSTEAEIQKIPDLRKEPRQYEI